MSVTTSPRGTDTLVQSYLFLRRAVGIIGLVLPVVLIVGNLLWPPGMFLLSISGSFYSPLRGVFVGSMCALGVFLLSYRGYGRIDDVAGNVAAVAAVGLALFPTTPDFGPSTGTQQVIGVFHIVFAGVFFLTLAFFCLYLFPMTTDSPPTRGKLRRNAVYRGCGVLILVSIVLIAVTELVSLTRSLHPMLWLETVAILAFGVAWAVKGETLGVLRDLR
jgi:hypothetical protein